MFSVSPNDYHISLPLLQDYLAHRFVLVFASIWLMTKWFLNLGCTFSQQSTNLKVEDVQLSMDDLEMIQVIGKGSGGVVQLVRHKWVGTFYALKVIFSAINSFWCTPHSLLRWTLYFANHIAILYFVLAINFYMFVLIQMVLVLFMSCKHLQFLEFNHLICSSTL